MAKDQESKKIAPLRKAVACPQCGLKSSRDTYPFCSKRCGDLDLGAWLNGKYAIPVVDADSQLPEE